MQGSLEMLKIALNPDAAYEICTLFAPDCEYQSRHILSYNSSFNENDYEEKNEKNSDEDDNGDLIHETINTINIFRPTTENPVRINKIQ